MMIYSGYTRCASLICIMLLSFVVLGCGGGSERAAPAVQPTGEHALNTAKTMLQGYINGDARGSEVESYDWIVDTVRESDPAKADILKTGLAELKTCSNSALKANAKKLLDQL